MMKLSCSYTTQPKQPTCNTAFVRAVFGIELQNGHNTIAEGVRIDYAPGKIVLFIGPSGAGKSSLLRAAADQVDDGIWLVESFDESAALVDTLGQDPNDAIALLSQCGLAEAMLLLRSPSELSDGQRYRYGLARCLAGRASTVVADEWCAKLDRTTARVVSFNVRRIADRQNIGFLLATTHEDIIEDLQPDIIVRCRPEGMVQVSHREEGDASASGGFRRAVSFLDQLEITEGTLADWPYFARWHYRGHGLGPVRRISVLWHDGQPIGICVLGYGPLSSARRNELFALPGKLSPSLAQWVNTNFASVTRLVIDPRYRGAGIAARFLKRCCEMSPWPWIELISEMANFIPFCRSAGFVYAGRAGGRKTSATRSGPRQTHYGKSNWTAKTFQAYLRRTCFSKPAYFLYDNRRESLMGSS